MGRSRGGLTTKIHALVDADGRPIRLMLTAGQANDAPVAEALLEDLADGTTLIADRAYDTNAIRALAAERGAWANIPPRSIRKGSFSFSTSHAALFLKRANHLAPGRAFGCDRVVPALEAGLSRVARRAERLQILEGPGEIRAGPHRLDMIDLEPPPRPAGDAGEAVAPQNLPAERLPAPRAGDRLVL
jgi:transposase